MKLRPENYTQFTKSQPWGYHPIEVEEKIEEYLNVIQKLNDKIAEEKQINMSLKQNIEKLQKELREMHLQMSNLELPDATEAVEHFVLDEFKNYNNNVNQMEQRPGTNNKYNNDDLEEDDSNEIFTLEPPENQNSTKLPFIIAK